MTQVPSHPLALGTDMNHMMETSQREMSLCVVISGGPSLAQS